MRLERARERKRTSQENKRRNKKKNVLKRSRTDGLKWIEETSEMNRTSRRLSVYFLPRPLLLTFLLARHQKRHLTICSSHFNMEID